MEDLSLRKDKTDGKVSPDESNEKTFDMQNIEQFELMRDAKLSPDKVSKEAHSADSSIERSKSISDDLPKASSLEEDLSPIESNKSIQGEKLAESSDTSSNASIEQLLDENFNVNMQKLVLTLSKEFQK